LSHYIAIVRSDHRREFFSRCNETCKHDARRRATARFPSYLSNAPTATNVW